MKSKLFLTAMFFFALMATAGCAKNTANNVADEGEKKDTAGNTAISSSAISSSAISSSAVRGDSVKEEFVSGISVHAAKKFRYANDWNIYEGNRNTGIYLYDLSGKKKKYYDVGKEFSEEDDDVYVGVYLEVLWVDNDCLFLSNHRNQEDYEIWLVPLKKKGAGKFPNFKRKEKLTEVVYWEGMIGKTKNKIVYCADGKICKLDLRTKKTQELSTGISGRNCSLVRDANGNPFLQDSKVYCDDDIEGDMYQIDLAKWEKTKFGWRSDGSMTTDGNYFYFMQDYLMKYNPHTGKKKKLFVGDKLFDKLQKMKVPVTKNGVISDKSEVIETSVSNIFYYNKRLYLSVEVEYEGEEYELDEDGNEVDVRSYGKVMFSCLAKDGSDLKYEKSIAEYLWKHSYAYTESFELVSTELTGDFAYLMGDSIVLHFYDKGKDKGADEEDKHRFVMYNLKDKSTRKIVRPSDEYGYLKAIGYSFYEEPFC